MQLCNEAGCYTTKQTRSVIGRLPGGPSGALVAVLHSTCWEGGEGRGGEGRGGEGRGGEGSGG